MLSYLVALDSTWLPRKDFCADIVAAIASICEQTGPEFTAGMQERDLLGANLSLSTARRKGLEQSR